MAAASTIALIALAAGSTAYSVKSQSDAQDAASEEADRQAKAQQAAEDEMKLKEKAQNDQTSQLQARDRNKTQGTPRSETINTSPLGGGAGSQLLGL